MDALSKLNPYAHFQKWAQHQSSFEWVVAFSGGLDSHVLLHLCAVYKRLHQQISLRAVHIDHGWNPKSSTWVEHCRQVCEDLSIPYTSFKVQNRKKTDQSPEAWARFERYSLFAKDLKAGESLLTAHTLDDQAETFLLQCMRGAGPKGLSSMGIEKKLGEGLQKRPLLGCSRQEIHAYGETAGLRWIEDPSNQDRHYLRNFIRLETLPKIKEKIPGVVETLVRSARLCGEAESLLGDLAKQDLEGALMSDGSLQDSRLLALNPARQKNALRFWLNLNDCPMPSEARLNSWIQQLGAETDRTPEIQWANKVARRFKSRWFIENIETSQEPYEVHWLGEDLLKLSAQKRLRVQKRKGCGLRIPENAKVVIKSRTGGESARIYAKQGSKALKKWWQVYEVPTWKRHLWPLLYVNDTLAAVPGLFICEGWQANEHEEGLEFTIELNK